MAFQEINKWLGMEVKLEFLFGRPVSVSENGYHTLQLPTMLRGSGWLLRLLALQARATGVGEATGVIKSAGVPLDEDCEGEAWTGCCGPASKLKAIAREGSEVLTESRQRSSVFR